MVRRTGMNHPSTRGGKREKFPLSQRIKEISEKVKIIRFGILSETKGSPWDRLAGMFSMSRPVDIEEMLDARGFEETGIGVIITTDADFALVEGLEMYTCNPKALQLRQV